MQPGKYYMKTFRGAILACCLTIAGISFFAEMKGKDPIVSGIHTLSIHVRDTISHDSVYQFLVHKLALPIYYTPEVYGFRRYAGIYAGNMVLEPCGPYPDIDYATDHFRSIFFGLNFEVHESLSSSEQALNSIGMKIQVNPNSIYVRDSILCSQNIFSALYEIRDKEKRDSLRNILHTSSEANPGIEYIKAIFVRYREEENLLRWKEFLHPHEIGNHGVCQVNDSLQMHFSRGDINEVEGITFKVKSLEKANQYLLRNNLLKVTSGRKTELDQSQTFGLVMYVTDEE